MNRPEEVLEFWFGREGEEGYGEFREAWFTKDAEFDHEVRDRFEDLHGEAAAGRLEGWKDEAESCLALIIVLDQFPRNMFRGDPKAYATDELARETAGYIYGIRAKSTLLTPLTYYAFSYEFCCYLETLGSVDVRPNLKSGVFSISSVRGFELPNASISVPSLLDVGVEIATVRASVHQTTVDISRNAEVLIYRAVEKLHF